MKANKVWLAILAVIPVFSFAGDYDSVVDDSVVGYWRFDNVQNYAEDSSSSKSDITGWSNGAAGKADAGRGGGYLNLPKSESNYGKATATLKGSRIPDLNSVIKGWTIATWLRGSKDLVDLNWLEKIAVGLSADATAFYNALTDSAEALRSARKHGGDAV